MPKRKKTMNLKEEISSEKSFEDQIKSLCKGLYYISETDAEIFPFSGTKAESVTAEELLKQTGNLPNASVEEREFDEMFARLTKLQDWFGDEEKATAAKFSAIKELLEKNLSDLKVFKIGRINIDIYFVGLDADGNLKGIQTKAIET